MDSPVVTESVERGGMLGARILRADDDTVFFSVNSSNRKSTFVSGRSWLNNSNDTEINVCLIPDFMELLATRTTE